MFPKLPPIFGWLLIYGRPTIAQQRIDRPHRAREEKHDEKACANARRQEPEESARSHCAGMSKSRVVPPAGMVNSVCGRPVIGSGSAHF